MSLSHKARVYVFKSGIDTTSSTSGNQIVRVIRSLGDYLGECQRDGFVHLGRCRSPHLPVGLQYVTLSVFHLFGSTSPRLHPTVHIKTHRFMHIQKLHARFMHIQLVTEKKNPQIVRPKMRTAQCFRVTHAGATGRLVTWHALGYSARVVFPRAGPEVAWVIAA